VPLGQLSDRTGELPTDRRIVVICRSGGRSGRAAEALVGAGYDAEAYAVWSGKKLPTREQWLRAYRGDQSWLLPWGDTYDAALANVLDNPLFASSTSRIEATPKDVSRDNVFNLVGNVNEFIRGTVLFQGQTYRAAKGAGFELAGYAFGIAPMQYRYGLNVSDKSLGFRCVVEETQE
jgi:hypothetical protein